MSTPGGCRYTYEGGSTSWSCPREGHEESDHCIFHREDFTPTEQLRSALLEELRDVDINGAADPHPRYVEAKLGALNLNHIELARDCPFPVDFRRAAMEVFSLDSSQVIRPLHLQRATIESTTNDPLLNFHSTLFRGEVLATETTVKGDVDLSSAECRRGLSFEDGDVYGDFNLNNAQIDGELNFTGLTINGDLHLENATIDGSATLDELVVVGDVHAHDLTVRGDLSCDEAKLATVGSPNQPIDFSQLTVRGKTTFDEARLGSATLFRNATFDGPFQAYSLTATGDMEFQTVEIHSCRLANVDTAKIAFDQVDVTDEFTIRNSTLKRLDCTGATFRGDTCVIDTHVKGAFLSENASYRSNVHMEKVKVDRSAKFTESEFDGRIRISEGYLAELDIERTSFHDRFQIRDRALLGRICASRTQFGGDVAFKDVRCTKTVDLSAAVFDGTLEIEDVDFEGDTTGEEACFNDHVTIVNSQFGRGISLRGSTFEGRLNVNSIEASDAGVVAVDLAHATIASGHLAKSTSGEFTYDLTHATVGNVRIETNTATFGDARVHQTTFDGFDFSSYRTELEAHEWRLHDTEFETAIPTADPSCPSNSRLVQAFWYAMAPVIVTLQTLIAGLRVSNAEEMVEQTDDTPAVANDGARETADPRVVDTESVTGPVTKSDVEEVQTTYLKAKNGASQVGATKIASEFFRREMHYRQVVHAVKLFSGPSRLVNSVRWLENGVLRVTAGYGERVKRVIVAAFCVIGGFAGLYSVLKPPEVDSVVDALAISTGSFVTLIFTDTPQFSSESLQMAAMTEGFLGALFIALLVFTLTRSIHR